MTKYIIVTSLMLFWAFYEMSGGADFEPKPRVQAETEVQDKPKSRNWFAQPTQTKSAAPPVTTTTALPQDDAPVFRTSLVVIPAPTVEAEVVEEAEREIRADVRIVAGDRVNLRQGPSTNDAVLDTIPYGVAVEVIDLNAAGWAQIRLTDSGQVGWMAARLLSDG